MRNFRLQLLLALLSLPSIFFAQEISITNGGTVTSCAGALVDSGMSAADYGANENFSITWCPESPETVLNLYWVIFNLDASSSIVIYDGIDNAAPVIGDYSLDELQGLDLFSGPGNATGCMTVEFTSGSGSSGNFAAIVTCGFPCDRPFAIVNPTELQPHYACLNEEVHLEATSSTVADGQEIVDWVWDLGDGTTDNTSGAILTHTYTQPGLYTMNLTVTDDNDCSNNNVLDYQILVSTDPDFSGTSSDITICFGDEVDLTGAIQGVLYNAEPSVDFGGGLFIPDDQSVCFYSDLTFTSFNPGAIISDANTDVMNIFMNFEHSYMGDLTITFICPNGSSVQVHQQGGGGTFLGEPVDNDADPDTPGIGYDYWWSPGATNGTWADNAQATLPSGVYESVQPFSNLNGCPLNGIWEIEVCDIFGSDNGFIFDWSIEFAPDLYPEAVTFTPSFGPDCDSTWWDGPSIINDNGNCSIVTISPTVYGVENYTFRGRNDFGCLYETSLNVTTVGANPTAVSVPAQFCGNPVTLYTNLGDGINPDDCTFSWNPATLLDSSNVQNTVISNLENTTDFTVTVTYNYPLTNNLVCISDASIRIETCEITIPNVFTPNNDGDNDRWLVDGLGAFNGSKLFIYNRWGTLVWSHLDFGSSAGWDPGIDGAAEGVYFYVLEINRTNGNVVVTDENGVEVEYQGEGTVPFSGSFTLLR